ncbi:hypothetical protein KIPB_006247 [Kipferlia bialata]|uniref:DUF7726 domain-containing protein n=1 Tax=Kipferlia bialata TaxID=797122 RepID=A0A9K3CWR4_9EUKA|nr:hypothetical protein KIPB_006247 [Kipferlia bialata]|eukprot:g6247.t1
MPYLEEQLEEKKRECPEGWIPMTPSGKLRGPGVLRNAIKKYLEERGTGQQGTWLSEIGVTYAQFNKFMKGTFRYKEDAYDSPVYSKAARFLEFEKIHKKIRARDAKAKAKGTSAVTKAPVKLSAKKAAAKARMDAVSAVPMEACPPMPVYDDCDIVRTKITSFLAASGATAAAFSDAIGVSRGNLTGFRKYRGKGAGAGSMAYTAAYRFFEQMRVLDGVAKTAHRVESEERWGAEGYKLRHDDGHRWVRDGEPMDPRLADIDYCKDLSRKK